jgi:hypothetical protein
LVRVTCVTIMHSTLYVMVIYRRTLDITRVESKLFDGERYLGSHCHVHPDSSPDDMSQCCAFLISPYLPLTDSASLHLVKYALHGTYSSHRCPHIRSTPPTLTSSAKAKPDQRAASYKQEFLARALHSPKDRQRFLRPCSEADVAQRLLNMVPLAVRASKPGVPAAARVVPMSRQRSALAPHNNSGAYICV